MRYFLLIGAMLFLLAPQGRNHRLTLKVMGLKPMNGDLYISLHNRPEYFQIPDSAYMKMKVAVNHETKTISFNDVPEGRYAIAVYHDENLNGMLDTNEKGIPREGYGFSTKKNFFGRPKFEQAAFDLDRNDTVEVQMIYHKGQGSNKDSIK